MVPSERPRTPRTPRNLQQRSTLAGEAAAAAAEVESALVLPQDPEAAFTVHTTWIETEFDNTIEPYAAGPAAEGDDGDAPAERQTIVVEVGGKRLEVSLPGGLSLGSGGGGAGRKKAPRRSGGSRGASMASGDSLTAPMQGTIVKIAVEEGATVAAGDLVIVLETMKMEQPITAHKDGIVTGLTATVGATVNSGAVLAEIKDADA